MIVCCKSNTPRVVVMVGQTAGGLFWFSVSHWLLDSGALKKMALALGSLRLVLFVLFVLEPLVLPAVCITYVGLPHDSLYSSELSMCMYVCGVLRLSWPMCRNCCVNHHVVFVRFRGNFVILGLPWAAVQYN